MFRSISYCLLCVYGFFFIACATPADYFLYMYAQAAMDGAKKVNANYLTPSEYTQALSYFNIGMSEFQKKNYDSAHEYFERSRKLSEKAELFSYLKKSQGGQLY